MTSARARQLWGPGAAAGDSTGFRGCRGGVMAGTGAGAGRVPGFLGRILDEDGMPAGTCFQVAPGVLVTAWHVLDEVGAAGLGAVVGVDPLGGGERFAAAVARADALRDLAVLASEEALPAVAGPLTATDGMPVRVP